MAYQIARNGTVKLHYENFGDPGGESIVLVAGAGAPAQFWPTPFCDTLSAAGFHVIRYWHRDTGHSTHCPETYGYEALLGDLTAVLDAATIDRGHLVGHSMGGYIAQTAMVEGPDRLVTACGISAGPARAQESQLALGLSQPDAALWPLLLANQPIGDFDKDWPGWLNSWHALHGSSPLDEYMARGYTRAIYEGSDANWLPAENHIHAMTTVPADLPERLALSDVPLLMIHGSEDPLVPPDHGECSARLARNGCFAPLPGAGHMFFNEDIWNKIAELVIGHCRNSPQTARRCP